MKNPISERVRKVKPSATITISSKAMEMRSAGVDVISMSAGEPDFDTPEYIKDAAKMAMDSGMTCLLYTSPSPRDRTRSRMPSSA